MNRNQSFSSRYSVVESAFLDPADDSSGTLLATLLEIDYNNPILAVRIDRARVAMIFTTNELKRQLKLNEQELQIRFHVKALSVFGSVARGEARATSDIDFVVEFSQPVGMIGFLKLKHYLEDLLHVEVDLATPNALHPQMKDSILKEAVRVA